MQRAPAEFQAAISHHNRHAVFGALLSLVGALVAWAFVYALFLGASLGALTLIHSTDFSLGETALNPPRWLHPAVAGMCGFLMVAGIADHRIRRYRPVTDRMVIGWHLIFEILLLPARVTISIFSQFGSMILLTPGEQYEAYRLLWIIFKEKRLDVSEVGRHTVMPGRISKLLAALQLVGWIDLHRKEDDWYYMVGSEHEKAVRRMTGIPLPSGEEEA